MVVRRLAKAKIAGSIPVSRLLVRSETLDISRTSLFYFALNFGDKWGQNGDNPFLGGLLPIEITFWPLPGSESMGGCFVLRAFVSAA